MSASILPYPGGKAKLRTPIINAINSSNFLEYREPFVGGGAIGLHYVLNTHADCWLNDRDLGVYSLWQSVAKHHKELIERIKVFEPTVERFDYLKEFFALPITSHDPVEIGFNKLAIHKLSFSGLGERGSVCGGQGQAKFTVYHRWSPENLIKKIEHIHDCFAWKQPFLSQTDYSELIMSGEDDPRSHVMIYLDPPYYAQGPAVYRHFFEDTDHARLSNLLRNTKHNWVLSYDDHWRIRDLYEWADIEVLDVTYSIANSVGQGGAKRQELLITPRRAHTIH